MELMRHALPEASLLFYVDVDARAKAEAVWAAFDALRGVLTGPVANSAKPARGRPGAASLMKSTEARQIRGRPAPSLVMAGEVELQGASPRILKGSSIL
jgi:hypothetical protein